MTRVQRMRAIARMSVEQNHTIEHHVAKEIAEHLAYTEMGGWVSPFLDHGWIPADYREVMELHRHLTFGISSEELVLAMGRYLRSRHQEGKTGTAHGWANLLP